MKSCKSQLFKILQSLGFLSDLGIALVMLVMTTLKAVVDAAKTRNISISKNTAKYFLNKK